MNPAADAWHSLSLGDGITSSGPIKEIRDLFQPQYEAAGKPSEMAIFTLFDSEGRPQCQVTAYFSPACAEIARALGGKPCNPPARIGLSLIAGDEDAWETLFT